MRFRFSLYGTPVAVSGRTFERGAAEQRVAPDVRRCDPERPLVNANVRWTIRNHNTDNGIGDAVLRSRCGTSGGGELWAPRGPVGNHAPACRCRRECTAVSFRSREAGRRCGERWVGVPTFRIRKQYDAPNRRSTRLAGGPGDRSRVSSTR